MQGSFCISNFERDPKESCTKLKGMMKIIIFSLVDIKLPNNFNVKAIND